MAISKSMVLAMLIGFLMSPTPVLGASVTQGMQVAATILDRGHCSFETSGPYLINFDPALDPLAPVERNASVTFQVRCKGVGHHGSTAIVDRTGSEQLYLTKGSDSIPYNLNLPTSEPVLKNNQPVDITVTATIAENTYRNASPGLYSDTITITVEP
ncbi:MAG TPA: hypothetical protein PLI53_00220 [Geobacteraceae bacterium]|nr:hypothetical protein [Geobacteraceae bacterium]